MEINWIYFVCVILCVHVDHSSEQSGLPSSPCQNMFQYQHDGVEWIGAAQIQSLRLGQTMKLEVMLSLRAQLPSVIMFLYPSYYHLVISWMVFILNIVFNQI